MPDFNIENLYLKDKVGGVDEAGRGPWAGPLVISCCIFTIHELSPLLRDGINDSKKVSPNKREILFEAITNSSIAKHQTAVVSNDDIDNLGLAKAWKKGVMDSISNLNISVCLIDGTSFVNLPKDTKCIPVIKGDQKSYSIAAASIIAKVTRDRIMRNIHNEFPEYGFDKHVGYGTMQHKEALKKFGPCKHHRKSYAPIRALLQDSV
ncbi:MAG: ribonuclease HII [Holosporales bacterium]|jgi:ribonuclease HII|nr:ribonuclease HII [Holosporales bacterium]